MPILTPDERLGTYLAGKYRLDRILGRGGFGVVYAGVHEWTGRAIAAKVLNYELAQQEAFVRRFLQEARAAAKLDHPNVVDVLDMGSEPDGTVYLVLELLQGEDLSHRLDREGALRPSLALEILLPVIDALAEAHARGIVHRDLKPDNIFLAVDAKGRMVPKLLDFGIAKVSGSSIGATTTGLVVGTPHYMAPEQARGQPDIGPSADVWSMGVVLWQCLTASVPYDASTPTGVLAAILTRPPPPFGPLVPGLGPLAAVVDRALTQDRSVRYADMSELLRALLEAGATLGILPSSVASLNTQPGTVPPAIDARTPSGTMPLATPPPSISVPTRRARWPFALGALIVLGSAVFGAAVMWPRPEVRQVVEPSQASTPTAPIGAPAPVPPTAPQVPSTVVGDESATATPREASNAPQPEPTIAAPPVAEPPLEASANAPQPEPTIAAPPVAEPPSQRGRARRRPRPEPVTPIARPVVTPLAPQGSTPAGARNGANASPIIY